MRSTITLRLRIAHLCIALTPAAHGCTNGAATDTAKNGNPHANESIGTVRQMYDGQLTPSLAMSTFRNIDRLFPTRTVIHKSSPYPLLPAPTALRNIAFKSEGSEYTLEDYISLNRVSGLLVLKNGRIAFERYALGNGPRTRWMSMSIAKSITSTLVGAALKDGKIGSIDDLVTKYVPRLVGSAYDGVTVRQLLTMTSGVRWNETYTDPASDRRRCRSSRGAEDGTSASRNAVGRYAAV